MSPLAGLLDQGRMTWAERERGWRAVPDEVVDAFARSGFEECKRESTTSRRDLRPAGGLWQGVDHVTGSVASAIWIARAPRHEIVVFIEIDGEPLEVDRGARKRSDGAAHHDEGGES